MNIKKTSNWISNYFYKYYYKFNVQYVIKTHQVDGQIRKYERKSTEAIYNRNRSMSGGLQIPKLSDIDFKIKVMIFKRIK